VPNFYTDNPDIQLCIDGLEMDRAVELLEGDFSAAAEYEFAPRNAPEAREQYAAVLEVAGEIAGEFAAPRAKAVDKEGNVLRNGEVILHPGLLASVRRFAEADLMGMSIERRYGGLNLPQVVKTAAIEMVARADASLMNIVGLQDIAETIEDYANEELRQEVLPRLCSGELTAAMVLTEPDAGSDLQRVRLRAEPVDEEQGRWKLTGIKRFITNGCGDVLVVLARSEPETSDGRGLSAYLVLKGAGVKIRRIEEKLGIHGSPTCEIQFNEAPARLIGARRRGLLDVAMGMMNGARVAIAAQAIGIAEAAAREATEYAGTRVQFGKAIREIPAVYEMLAGMRIEIEAARALTYRAAHVVELLRGEKRAVGAEGKPAAERKRRLRELSRLAGVLTPLAKYYATEMANRVASDAIQVLGGSGYMRDYPVERHFRDARITNIYEGTSQLQVVGAVGGVLSGVLRKHLDELLAEAAGGAAQDLAGEISALLPQLDESIAVIKEKSNPAFRDLYARRVVDIALDLYLATLLALQAARDEKRKRAVAEAFLAGARHRVRANAAEVAEGSRVLIERRDEIIG